MNESLPVVSSVRSRIRALIADAWAGAAESGALAAVAAEARPDIEVERPSNPDHGDLSTNLAMKLARPMRRSPLQIAEALAATLADVPAGAALSHIEVAPPGFLNVRLSAAWLEGVLEEARVGEPGQGIRQG